MTAIDRALDRGTLSLLIIHLRQTGNIAALIGSSDDLRWVEGHLRGSDAEASQIDNSLSAAGESFPYVLAPTVQEAILALEQKLATNVFDDEWEIWRDALHEAYLSIHADMHLFR